jgi:ubiquinone/menaquinone biosynthesis C-methylase UbiE
VRSSPFRLIGFGEFLPFRNGSVDNVVFNTSLDHIMDWRRSIGEARRVLKPGGCLTIATLIWTDKADLLADAVHFHHFRDYEIYGALALNFTIESERRYVYKNSENRHGMYIQATSTALLDR